MEHILTTIGHLLWVMHPIHLLVLMDNTTPTTIHLHQAIITTNSLVILQLDILLMKDLLIMKDLQILILLRLDQIITVITIIATIRIIPHLIIHLKDQHLGLVTQPQQLRLLSGHILFHLYILLKHILNTIILIRNMWFIQRMM